MDSFIAPCAAIDHFLNENTELLLTWDAPFADFRKTVTGNFTAHGIASKVELPILADVTYVELLCCSLLSTGNTVIVWNIKSLCSWFRYHLGYSPAINATIYDLSLLESFAGIPEAPPVTYAEAQNRLQRLVGNEALMDLHRRIHLPLATQVVPLMETLPLASHKHKKVYSSYTIEGQIHGRMQTAKQFEECWLPHSSGDEHKADLRPPADRVFVLADYRHMEASILQWLSNDEILGDLLKESAGYSRQGISTAHDLYLSTFALLAGKPSRSAENRLFIKRTMLPVFYGAQAGILAESLDIKPGIAQWIIDRYREHFPGVMGWLDDHQENARLGKMTVDYFGRTRDHSKRPWVARNAVVQGPAAMVCLEKLIQLHEQLGEECDLVASIHDGYLMTIPARRVHDLIPAIQAVLESPSDLCPGLQLRVACRYGNDLLNLRTIDD